METIYSVGRDVREKAIEAVMTLIEILDQGFLKTYREWKFMKRERDLMEAGYYENKDIYGSTKADNFD